MPSNLPPDKSSLPITAPLSIERIFSLWGMRFPQLPRIPVHRKLRIDA